VYFRRYTRGLTNTHRHGYHNTLLPNSGQSNKSIVGRQRWWMVVCWRRRHALFPLLSLVSKKCELATSCIIDATTSSSGVCSVQSFDEDLRAFALQASDARPELSVGGSILCDPIQPNPSITSGKIWIQPNPTHRSTHPTDNSVGQLVLALDLALPLEALSWPCGSSPCFGLGWCCKTKVH